MQHPGFFHPAGPFALRDIAEKIGAVLKREEEGSRMVADVKSLRNAGSDDLAVFDNRKASLTHAIIGNGVIIHSGVRIGQDGSGSPWGLRGI